MAPKRSAKKAAAPPPPAASSEETDSRSLSEESEDEDAMAESPPPAPKNTPAPPQKGEEEDESDDEEEDPAHAAPTAAPNPNNQPPPPQQREDLTPFDAKIRSLFEESKKLGNKICEEVQSKLSTMRNERKTVLGLLQSKTEAARCAEAKAHTLKKENKMLREKVCQLEKENKMLREKVCQLEQEQQRCNKVITSITEQFEEIQQALIDLSKGHGDAVVVLKRAQEKTLLLEKELTKLDEDNVVANAGRQKRVREEIEELQPPEKSSRRKSENRSHLRKEALISL